MLFIDIGMGDGDHMRIVNSNMWWQFHAARRSVQITGTKGKRS